MKRLTVAQTLSQTAELAGHSIIICGMVQRLREFKNHIFLVVRDHTGIIQCVMGADVAPLIPAAGSMIKLSGTVVAQPKAPGGAEMQVSALEIYSQPAGMLPVTLDLDSKETLETALDHRPVSLRNLHVNTVFRVASLVCRAFRQSMEEQQFVEIHTPKLVGGGSEGGAQVFTVNYFDRLMSLAQSPQQYKQICAGALGRVYEIGPVFRAENSHTSRHLTEFTGLDFEIAFIEDKHDVMNVAEHFLRKIFEVLKSEGQTLLETLNVKLPEIKEIPRISYRDAEKLVQTRGTLSADVNPDMAVGLAAQQEFGAELIFIYGYPRAERPFYTMPTEADPDYTESFDILYRGLEISSGAQRIHAYDQFVSSLKAHGLDPANYPGYLEAFSAGMPPHGGAGLGLERITQTILGLTNVREATLFPRDVRRTAP